jgi:hypothetical protein
LLESRLAPLHVHRLDPQLLPEAISIMSIQTEMSIISTEKQADAYMLFNSCQDYQ